MKRTEHYVIEGTIECLSGCRIGGSDDTLQIGGTDLTCIKHPTTQKPYLPGSSLKGKLRSEIEKMQGKVGGRDENEPCGCARDDCLVCRVFGPHKKSQHSLGPSRIIVRDAELLEGGELEVKTENIIDRKVGTALHPRQVERVAAGAIFRLMIGLQVWDIDGNCEWQGKRGGEALVRFVRDGLRLIERTGIGSGVSKGYGQVRISILPIKRLQLPSASTVEIVEEEG
jgi:CRISPR-associated protein Csm3